MWQDFKEFAMKGNIVDMAIGVIIGAAFSKVVNSLVSDVIMPPIGLILGKIDFDNLFLNLSGKQYPSLEVAKAAGAPTVNYGTFLTNMIDFLVVAFLLFIIFRELSRLSSAHKEAEVITTKTCPYCFETIHIKATRCPRCTADLSDHPTKSTGNHKIS